MQRQHDRLIHVYVDTSVRRYIQSDGIYNQFSGSSDMVSSSVVVVIRYPFKSVSPFCQAK